MPRGLFVDRPEHATIHSYEDQPLTDDQVRIKTTFAAIKHGTLFHIFSGKSPFGDRYFDTELRIFLPKKPENASHAAAIPADKPGGHFMGNAVAGTVAEVGKSVTQFKVGDRVWAYGPTCETLSVSEKNAQPLDGISEQDAMCLDPGLFGYGAVRDARVSVGDNVAVFGMGAIGLFAIQLLKLSGCLNIIAIDPLPKRRQLAQRLGATAALDPLSCDVGLEVHKIVDGGTDVTIECSGHYAGLRHALRTVAQCGKVVTVGYYKGRETDLDLGAEWHHNRLEMISSMPDWGNPLRDHPHWTRQRIQHTLVTLFRQRKLTSEGIMDPIVPFDQAAEAFMSIYKDPSQAIKLGFRF